MSAGATVQARLRCSMRSGPAIRAATASASARRRPRSWARARSCSCAASGRGRQHGGAGRLDAPQRGSRGRRSPRRAAAAQREGPDGAPHRRAHDRALARARMSVWVTAADEPSLVKVANIQHLATPIRAQLAEPLSVVELAGALHPTSAVGGEPWERARGAGRRARAARPRLVRRPGRLDGRRRGRRVVRRAALRAAERDRRPLLRGRRHRGRLGSRRPSWPRPR